jgi:Flp pilus assembly protein TadG
MATTRIALHRPRGRGDRGQSIVEFAVTLPLLLVVTLGVIETAQALMAQHVITKTAREGSNMISRETPLPAAGTALRTMSSDAASFDSKTKVIFSVLLRSNSGANSGQLVLYQRYEIGNLSLGSSQLNGSCSCSASNDYTATNPHNNTGLRVTNAPSDIASVPGSMIYVTEVYHAYETLTPVRSLGIGLPEILYSIAYF